MSRYKIIFCFLFLLLFCRERSIAQRYLGIATDGWNVFNTMYLNPANIAGREESVSINLFSFSLGAESSSGQFTGTGNLFGELSARNYNNLFTNSGNKNFNSFAPDAEIRGPGILIAIDNRNTIAITTGFRAISQFNNFNQQLFNSITVPGATPNTSNNGSYKNFSMLSDLYSQVGITYAGVLAGPGKHQLNFGITARYLAGIGYLSIRGTNMNINYTKGSDSLIATQTSVEYASNFANPGDEIGNGIDMAKMLGALGNLNGNSGIGGDVGISYFYRPAKNFEEDKSAGNGYKLRVSASVIDLGYLTYKGSDNQEIEATGSGTITGSGLLASSRDVTDFRNYTLKQGFKVNTFSYNMTTYLPTSLIISADYQVKDRYYVNLTYSGNLMQVPYYSNFYSNQISIIPRYDSRSWSIGLPISYSTLAGSVNAGLGLRVSAFFAGADNLLALISKSQPGLSFYMGANLPVFKKKDVKELEEFDP